LARLIGSAHHVGRAAITTKATQANTAIAVTNSGLLSGPIIAPNPARTPQNESPEQLSTASGRGCCPGNTLLRLWRTVRLHGPRRQAPACRGASVGARPLG
jgi:hypothetical protein